MQTLITTGMKCPKPLFEISKAIKRLAAEEIIEVHADDPAFPPDIEAWCRRTGHELMELATEGEIYVARIRKVEAKEER